MHWTRVRDAKIERLRQLPLLRCCTDDEIRRLAAAGELVELPVGAALQRRDNDIEWLHLVLDGEVSRVGEPEALVGQTAVLAGTDARDDVLAATDVLVLLVGRREFRALIDTAPGFRSAVITSMARTVAAHGAPSPGPAAEMGEVFQLPVRPLVSAG